MHENEKPPYFLFWLLAIFFIFGSLVIGFGFAQKTNSNKDIQQEAIETITIEQQETYL